MTADELAALHARAFTTPAPWTAQDFADLLAEPTVRLLTRPGGFLMLRVVAGEAEILTLAVDPSVRRQGTGRALVAQAIAIAEQFGADRIFLEVSAENAAARALYAEAGFAQAGDRRGYYRTPEGGRADALILARAIDAASG